MVGTVKTRLNHYETLGISPNAASDEIARAFAREGSVFRPHAFGGLAELCIAYETLRDPIKRRAYDASLGLEGQPAFENRSIGAREARTAEGAAPTARIEQRATDIAPPAATRPKPQTWPEPLAARTLGSVNGGSPRQRQDSPAETKSALPLHPGADLNARPEPRIGRAGTPRLQLEEELGVEARPINWRRTGTALGVLVVAACTLGGLAGWWSSSGVGEASQPENAVSVSLPPAKPLATPSDTEIVLGPVRAPAPATVPNSPEARLDRARPAIAAADQIELTPTAPEPAAAEGQPQQDQFDPNLGEQAAVEAPATSTIAAPMPLPDRVIARTIQRIGYSCGKVDSTAPVEGEAPGVYKVTCSSGQSYQARPVNGRYHFRRWGRL